MFKIAMSLRLIDIISKSWHLLQTFGWELKLQSGKKYMRQTLISIFQRFSASTKKFLSLQERLGTRS